MSILKLGRHLNNVEVVVEFPDDDCLRRRKILFCSKNRLVDDLRRLISFFLQLEGRFGFFWHFKVSLVDKVSLVGGRGLP